MDFFECDFCVDLGGCVLFDAHYLVKQLTLLSSLVLQITDARLPLFAYSLKSD